MSSWPPLNGDIELATATALATGVRPEPHARISRSNYLLWWAVERNDLTGASLILHHPEFDVNFVDYRGATPLVHAAAKGPAEGGHQRMVELLLAHCDTQADSRNLFNATPLAVAAESGHVEIVDLLVRREDVDADSRDNGGRSPLARAAAIGHEATVRVLLSRPDVAVNSRDEDGYTPLAWAALRGHRMVVEALMERPDLEWDVRADDGWRPAELALDGGHNDVAQVLGFTFDAETDDEPQMNRGRARWNMHN
ncbi:hypothetical protein N7527_007384 [Penicillium freii]|nr:hypothetical protein N7527_007384 [Penicillium freii]